MSRNCVMFLVVFALHVNLGLGQAQERSQGSTTNPTTSEKIDFEKARSLFQKQQRGEELSDSERSYLQRAMEERRKRDSNAPSITPKDRTGWKPINEMTSTDRYKDQDGGLYGQGLNIPPEKHRIAATQSLSAIRPLDKSGMPTASGKIGFISISMSNATQEFSMFKQIADADNRKSKLVAIVDCAQGGQAMAEWVPPQGRPWEVLHQRLGAADVSPTQVQVVWLKIANKGPRGELQEHGKLLQRDTLAVIQNAASRFPNLKVIYLSSRIYGGYASGPLNPEPYAYESGFVARWLIQDQMDGSTDLNFDPSKGNVKSPILLWGPYLWADGVQARKSDGLTYSREDLADDGTHPSQRGREKVAKTMLEFFLNDPLAKCWFHRN